MKLQKRHIIGIAAALLMVLGSFIFLLGEKLFWFILVLALIVSATPFVVSVIIESGRKKEVEERFLEFVRDLVENVKSGTPISKSIINLRARDYGPLSKYTEKLANQISLGIPLTKAMNSFAKDTKNSVIQRSVSLISEAEKAGGQVDTILESVSKSVNQTEDLKKERKSSVYNIIVQGYIIFIVFIVIMLVLQYMILPWTLGISDVEGLSLQVQKMTPQQFATPLLLLLIVQSIFSGLVIGKISEGSLVDGVKHSFILLILTLLITTGANVFVG